MLSPDLTQTFSLGAQPMKNRSHELTATIKAVEIFVRRFSVKNFGGLSPTIDTAKLPPQAGVDEGAVCLLRAAGDWHRADYFSFQSWPHGQACLPSWPGAFWH